MNINDAIRKDLQKMLNYGEPVRFRFFNGSLDPTDYNDVQSLAKSGSDYWTSGLWFPVNASTRSSNDAVLIEQGKIQTSDKKVFVDGITPSAGVWKLGVGSPIREEYSMVAEGVNAYETSGSLAYKCFYVRILPTGSLAGEGY